MCFKILKMFKIRICILLAVGFVRPIQSFNYCSGENATALCTDSKHFMCDMSSVPILDKLMAHVPLSRKVRDNITDLHNTLRAKIAKGEEVNGDGVAFPKAKRLREFVWSTELAAISKVHAGRCNLEHDTCHNTQQFKFSGQNLAYRSTGDTLESIEKMVYAWHNEKDLVGDPATYPDKLSTSWKETGHFSVMINEKNANLGCSVAWCDSNDKEGASRFYMTCNYGFTNMHGSPIYAKGDEAASDCKHWDTGKSSKYPGLCENNGKFI